MNLSLAHSRTLLTTEHTQEQNVLAQASATHTLFMHACIRRLSYFLSRT